MAVQAVRRAAVAALVSAVVGALLVLSPPAAEPAAAATCRTPFTASFVAALKEKFPTQRYTAAVKDTRTGCWYHLNRGMQITTASVVKAGVLGAVLLKAQDARRGLTDWERFRIGWMITYSHNNPYVSDLYSHLGGVAGMDRFDRRVGATATTNTLAYGRTWTTAEDRTKVALAMLHGGGPLGASARAEAWHYMANRVHSTQRWGITAGVPSGWSVALKNGFYPTKGYGWRAGSTGFVRQGATGQGYAVTILTDKGSSMPAGMLLVETISRRIASELTDGAPASRVVDRSICTRTSAGESWSTVARRVGQPSTAAAAVRRVSGGNSSPLQGQRACSPVLRSS